MFLKLISAANSASWHRWQQAQSNVRCRKILKAAAKPEKNLVFLLFQQPVDVVILVSLSGPDDVFGTDDVEERLPLRVLC